MKRITSVIVCMLLFGVVAMAQDIQVTGKVTSSDDGADLPGVSVVVKGTTIGTATSVDGAFSMSAPSDATLVFSSMGYITQEVALAGQTTLNVVMQIETTGLEEVVVTALGISREKKSLGYAVQDVGADELNSSIQTDALSALSGKVAGLDVISSSKLGGSSRILIRGANSIMGENQPLIVLDGIPMDNQDFNNNAANGFGGDANGFGGYDNGNMLNDINPEDIESMSVLKGPAAAIYGSRASNGVIVITTKSAKRGKEQFSVDFSSNLGFEQIYLLPVLQTKYGGGVIIDDEDGGVNGFEQINVGGTDYLIPQYQVDESWGPRYDANVSVLHWDAWDQESFPDQYLTPRPWVAPENDVDSYYDLGVSFTNSITATRSGENYGVIFSYTNANVTGTMPGSEQHKNNFRLKGNTNLGKKIRLDGSLSYIQTDTKGRPQVGYGDNSTGQKFFQWGQRQLDYEKLKDYKNNDGTMRTWNRSAYNDPTPKYSDNPYWTAYENYPDDSRQRYFGNMGFTWEIIDNLRFKTTSYFDNYTMYNRERTAVGAQAQSKYYEGVRSNAESNLEALLSYGKQFGDIGLNAFAGANRRYNLYEFNRSNTVGGLVVPEVYNSLNSTDAPIINDQTLEKQVNSVFASLALDYKGFLFLEATVRNDWSSTLPEDDNSYFYPAVSASWLFSDHLQDISWLSLGKARLGWAEVGNDTDPYNVYTVYEYNTDGPFQGAPRTSIDDDLQNRDLLSERTVSQEFGFDLGFLNNRVNLNFTYYNNVTFDQILPLEVSKASGYDTKWINSGQMTNKGIELFLELVPVQQSNLTWSIAGNFAKNTNTLDELIEGVDALDLTRAPFSGATLRATEGEPYGQLWVHDYIYDDAGNKVVGDNGVWLTTPDLVPIGSVLPDYTLGIRNSFTIYKNFNFSFLFDIRQGGKYYSVTHMWGMYSGMLEETAALNDKGNEIRDDVLRITDGDGNVTGYEDATGGIRLDGVTGTVTYEDDGSYTVTDTEPNETYISGIGWAARHYHGYGTPSMQSVFDADYIKLRELTIGYTLPSGILGPIKSATVSLYGRNLATFGLDQPGFDPEAFVNGSGNIQGIDGGIFPSSRTFGINLKLGF